MQTYKFSLKKGEISAKKIWERIFHMVGSMESNRERRVD